MHLFPVAAIVLANLSAIGTLQDNPKSKDKFDAQRCTPKVVSHARQHKSPRIRIRKGEEPSGYSAIVAFEILESGEVANAFVKRSSGIADVDSRAVTWIRATKYNKRSGCGVIETQAGVTIDWR